MAWRSSVLPSEAASSPGWYPSPRCDRYRAAACLGASGPAVPVCFFHRPLRALPRLHRHRRSASPQTRRCLPFRLQMRPVGLSSRGWRRPFRPRRPPCLVAQPFRYRPRLWRLLFRAAWPGSCRRRSSCSAAAAAARLPSDRWSSPAVERCHRPAQTADQIGRAEPAPLRSRAPHRAA